jgi:hypothetical protein
LRTRFDDPGIDAFRKKYTDLQSHRQECSVLFFSHRWLSPYYDPAADSAAPSDTAVSSGHPDDPSDARECLKKLKDGELKDKQVFIWIDFSCLSQTSNQDIQLGIDSLPSFTRALAITC